MVLRGDAPVLGHLGPGLDAVETWSKLGTKYRKREQRQRLMASHQNVAHRLTLCIAFGKMLRLLTENLSQETAH